MITKKMIMNILKENSCQTGKTHLYIHEIHYEDVVDEILKLINESKHTGQEDRVWNPCSTCGGSGVVEEILNSADYEFGGAEPITQEISCEDCGGNGGAYENY